MFKKVILWLQKNNRRSIRNYLLRPRLQLGLATYIVFTTLSMTLLALFFCYQVFAPFITSLIEYTDNAAPQYSAMFYENITSVMKVLIAFAVLYVVLTYIFIIYYSHRVVGPAVAFKRYIRQIMNKNYKDRLRLRHGDEFQDVADELNQLAIHLNDKI